MCIQGDCRSPDLQSGVDGGNIHDGVNPGRGLDRPALNRAPIAGLSQGSGFSGMQTGREVFAKKNAVPLIHESMLHIWNRMTGGVFLF